MVSKSMKHSIYTHFPEDRNCEVCLRTKMTRAPCRRCTGEAVPRAEKFGDVTTADHKVPNEEGESRNNHRHAVVVRELATQWIHRTPWSRIERDQVALKEEKVFVTSGKKKASVREETNAVSGTTAKSVQNWRQNPIHSLKVLAQNYLVTIGILPNVNSISLNQVVTSAISARFRTERLRNNRIKSRKTW